MSLCICVLYSVFHKIYIFQIMIHTGQRNLVFCAPHPPFHILSFSFHIFSLKCPLLTHMLWVIWENTCQLFVLRLHLIELMDFFWLCSQNLHPEVLRGSYGILKIEPRSVLCKTNVLLAVLFPIFPDLCHCYLHHLTNLM